MQQQCQTDQKHNNNSNNSNKSDGKVGGVQFKEIECCQVRFT